MRVSLKMERDVDEADEFLIWLPHRVSCGVLHELSDV